MKRGFLNSKKAAAKNQRLYDSNSVSSPKQLGDGGTASVSGMFNIVLGLVLVLIRHRWFYVFRSKEIIGASRRFQ